jgi:tRNA threonylcarbamoyl adenosine modification protein YeaZ
VLILAADASLPILSVALLNDRSLLGAIALEGKGSRNEKLLPAIDWLLSESGIDRKQVELFATTRGPGSFTGVRIGLATMQGLALALNKPVCAMSTHEAIVGQAILPDRGQAGLPVPQIAVFDDAGRGEFYVSLFDGHREVVPPRLATAGERDELIKSAALVIPVAEFMQHGNAAVGCAQRARELAGAPDAERYHDVTPIYVRLAEAEVKLQQKLEQKQGRP